MFVYQPSEMIASTQPAAKKERRTLSRERSLKTGATGLETATSGVTGLFSERDDRRQLTRYRSIDAGLRAAVV